MNEEPILEEPIIIFGDDLSRGKSIKSDVKTENRLLRGIILHPGSFKSAAKFAGIRNMADAYRTLDRLALRRDYQEALSRHGVDMDFIVTEVKGLAIAADLDSTRLNALRMLMRSMGLDSYGKEEEGAQGWEKTISSAVVKNKVSPQLSGPAPYEVNRPVMPASLTQERKDEADLGKELYEQP